MYCGRAPHKRFWKGIRLEILTVCMHKAEVKTNQIKIGGGGGEGGQDLMSSPVLTMVL